MSSAHRRSAREDPEVALERLRLANEVILARYRFWTITVVSLIGVGALAVSIPIARVFAGVDTNINVAVSLAASLTLAVTTAATGTAAHWQRKRVRAAEARVDGLTATVRQEKDARTADKEREMLLEGDLKALRADNAALRKELGRSA